MIWHVTTCTTTRLIVNDPHIVRVSLEILGARLGPAIIPKPQFLLDLNTFQAGLPWCDICSKRYTNIMWKSVITFQSLLNIHWFNTYALLCKIILN